LNRKKSDYTSRCFSFLPIYAQSFKQFTI